MSFTIPITSVQYIYLRHCRFFAFLAKCLSKVYSTRNSVFFALQYCYVKCCKICQNKKNGISQFLDKQNVSIAYKENKRSGFNICLYLLTNCATQIYQTQEKVRSSMQVYKIKDNTWKMNSFGHLPDNVRRQKMSLCKEDVCIVYISKTRGHLLAPGGRTRCLHSQLPLQSTGQIQLMEKGNGTH